MRVTGARGYTLVELVVVVGIIALVAMVAVPQTASNDPHRLAIAAAELSDAIRYARSEALRVGVPHGFTLTADSKVLRLYRIDTSTFLETPIYDVRHPVSKQLYTVDLNQHPFAASDSVVVKSVFRGSCGTDASITFDTAGTPRCLSPANLPLQDMQVELQLGELLHEITLTGVTGRVSLQ